MSTYTPHERRILWALSVEPDLTATGLARRLTPGDKRGYTLTLRELEEQGVLTCQTVPEPGRLNPAKRYRLAPGVTL